MTLSPRELAVRFGAVLRLDDPPRRLALALAVGVFISCTPFWGLQTLLSLAVATVFHLNKAATVTGTWLNLPWFAPFVYAAALRIGAGVVPVREGFHGVSLALLVGTTIVGVVAACATYVVALVLISRRRASAAGPPSSQTRAA
ncbi:MAG: DUF2062 domain-containing protein [Candidatus Rokubacteria bacterium]|nr:DUF2062 domain-containing protein [Candidatus Rokubacteria bacterium]